MTNHILQIDLTPIASQISQINGSATNLRVMGHINADNLHAVTTMLAEKRGITFLGLSNQNLVKLEPQGLQYGLAGLKNSYVTNLSFKANSLGHDLKSLNAVINSLSDSPVTAIHLNENKLSLLGADLKNALADLKKTQVNTLSLDNNDLGNLSADELKMVLNSVTGSKVESIFLNDKTLSKLDAAGLKTAFSGLEGTRVHSIGLNCGLLYDLGNEGIKTAFEGFLRTRVTTISLGETSLLVDSGLTKLKAVLSMLAGTKITNLQLHQSQLGSLGGAGLREMFKSLAKTEINSISLKDNDLNHIVAADLKSAFSGLEGTKVHTLNLSNTLECSDKNRLVTALSGLPASIKNLHLRPVKQDIVFAILKACPALQTFRHGSEKINDIDNYLAKLFLESKTDINISEELLRIILLRSFARSAPEQMATLRGRLDSELSLNLPAPAPYTGAASSSTYLPLQNSSTESTGVNTQGIKRERDESINLPAYKK